MTEKTKFQFDVETANRLKEICGDDEELYRDMVEGETSLNEKLNGALYRYAEAKQIMEAMQARQKEVAERAKRKKGEMERLVKFMAFVLPLTGKAKHEAVDGTIYKKNVPPKPIIIDEDKVPSLFKKIEESIDKSAINQEYKEGREVEGCAMDNGGETWVVKLK